MTAATWIPDSWGNVFSHESGIHVAAVMRNPRTYEPIDPRIVGNRRRIIIGKHSGRHVIEAKLRELGIEMDEDEINMLIDRVKLEGEKKGRLSDDDLIRMAMEVKKVYE